MPCVLLVLFLFIPAQNLFINQVGVTFDAVQNNTPADMSGLYPDMIIDKVDNTEISNHIEFQNYLSNVKPNQTLNIFSNNGEKFNNRKLTITTESTCKYSFTS